jgi:TRAP-type C4-dicarboxylate transport system substrate-binding protein
MKLKYPDMEFIYDLIAEGLDEYDPTEMEDAGENEMDYVWDAWEYNNKDGIMTELHRLNVIEGTTPQEEWEETMDDVWLEWLDIYRDDIWDELYKDLQKVKEYYPIKIRRQKLEKLSEITKTNQAKMNI